MEKLNYCPFKGAKNAGVALDDRVIFKFDCPYVSNKRNSELLQDKKMFGRYILIVSTEDTVNVEGFFDTIKQAKEYVKENYLDRDYYIYIYKLANSKNYWSKK